MEAIIVFSVISLAYLLFRNARLERQNSELKEAIAQEIGNNIFNDKEGKESFVKFLSDSREWAFDYIEEVQQGLNNFVNAVDKDITHFDNYGEAIYTPHADALKNISVAYKDLKKLLPEENNA